MVCLDEKPIQLLDEVRPTSGIGSGEVRKVENEYKKNGKSSFFCAEEPLSGKYINKVSERGSRSDFAKFLYMVARKYENVEKIVLEMDNLNTHKEKSLIHFYWEEERIEIWKRFDVHSSPKHGRWLNQAEIPINMYARQCLEKSRIPDIELLRKKISFWNKLMNQKAITINWRRFLN